MMIRSDGSLEHLEFVPEESARDIDDKEDSYVDGDGNYDKTWKEKIRRKYVVGKMVGPNPPAGGGINRNKNWDFEAERKAL
jgi:hypothetical protein